MAKPVELTGIRRRLVKRYGKRLLRGALHDFLAGRSLVPNDPVLDAEHFAWAEELRESWPAMRRELDQQLLRRDSLPNFQDISPDQWRISRDDRWKTFVFVGFGVPSELNRELCPETARALDKIPTLTNAFYSVLGPGKHIPQHRGVTKGLLRCHLGLKVPKHKERCRMQVGDQGFFWEEGKIVFFDDTCPHEVWNDTDEERAVLFIDFERPMTRSGRFVSRVSLWVLRHTAYFRDAQRNQQDWEKRYRASLEGQAP